jgi:hypothetical protein
MKYFMDFHEIKLDRLILIFHIHQIKGLIKPVPVNKEEHQLGMPMFRAYLSQLRIKMLVLILQIKCCHQLRKLHHQLKRSVEILALMLSIRDFKDQHSRLIFLQDIIFSGKTKQSPSIPAR